MNLFFKGDRYQPVFFYLSAEKKFEEREKEISFVVFVSLSQCTRKKNV